MHCPFCTDQPTCDYAVECAELNAALDEAEELCTALNAEVDSLKLRIRQLEQYIMDAGLNLFSETL